MLGLIFFSLALGPEKGEGGGGRTMWGGSGKEHGLAAAACAGVQARMRDRARACATRTGRVRTHGAQTLALARAFMQRRAQAVA